MRLHFILPKVDPDNYPTPSRCPYCHATDLHLAASVPRHLRDTRYNWVMTKRYRCRTCKRSFRVHPEGVTRSHFSQRVKAMVVMLYLSGMSYTAVSLAMEQLVDVPISRTEAYYILQQSVGAVQQLQQQRLLEVCTQAIGADVTTVMCAGKPVKLGVIVDEQSREVLCVQGLSEEDAQQLQQLLAPVAEAVGAEVLVTDDADSWKEVADGFGLAHQVCISHVVRNTEALVERLRPLVQADADGSLGRAGIGAQEALQDLERLMEVVHARRVEDISVLRALRDRYQRARAPSRGESWEVAYQLRMLYLDRSELWHRLVLYRSWEGRGGFRLDGTNNGCERMIGQYIKERYRVMRGYKKVANAVGMSGLLCWAGNYVDKGGADLRLVVR